MKQIFLGAAILAFLCMLAGNTAAQLSQNYMVKNNTGMTLTTVVISQSGANKWSTNLSANDKLLNNETFEFKQPVDKANCQYDIKFIADDGKEYLLKDVNLCLSTSISFDKPADMKQK
jgi:hypothetical protein